MPTHLQFSAIMIICVHERNGTQTKGKQLEEFIDIALQNAKSNIIFMIDKGLYLAAIQTLERARPLFCSEQYAYKGVELCERLAWTWQESKGSTLPRVFGERVKKLHSQYRREHYAILASRSA